jgi:hypothetical protein
MIEIRPSLLATLLAFVSALEMAGAAEPNPVGIVMEITGQTTPNLPIRQEIPADAMITLGPGVELTFLHYPPDCELVTVSGGTLKLSRTAFTTDGDIKRQQGRPCPRFYEVSGTGGAWVARSLEDARDPLRLPIEAEIIFAGSRADQVTAAAVYEQDRLKEPLFRFELADRRATQPVAAARLARDRQYVLRLTMKDSSQPVDYPFTIASAGSDDSLVVLHVD